MKEETKCDLEHSVIRALRTGVLSEEISGHIALCENCRETAKVVGFFQNALANEPSPENLPSYGLVWWKSRLREKQRAAERAGRPLVIAQTAAIIFAFAAFIGLWQSQLLQNSIFGPAVTRVFDSIGQLAVPLTIGTVCFLIICAILRPALNRLMHVK